MIRQDVMITNSIGLHARPATYLIQKATSYRCRVKIGKDSQEVNAKSLLGVLSLGIAKGMTSKEIADKLCLSVHTVTTHRRNITTKLQIHTPAGLTIYAIVNKLVSLSDIKLQ